MLIFFIINLSSHSGGRQEEVTFILSKIQRHSAGVLVIGSYHQVINLQPTIPENVSLPQDPAVASLWGHLVSPNLED